MKTKKLSTKLKLNKKTIANLSSQEQMKIHGGMPTVGGRTMLCTEGWLTLCETFCDASWYTECIETGCQGTHPINCDPIPE